MRHYPILARRLPGLSIALCAGLTASASAQGSFPPTDPFDNFTPIVQQLQSLPFTLGRAIGKPLIAPPTRGAPLRLYDNTDQDSLFIIEAQYPRAGDEGSLASRLPVGRGASVGSVEFGVYINPGPGGGASFDAYILFYDTHNPDASPVNSDFIAGFVIEIRDVMGAIAYSTGPIDLMQIFPGGLVLPDNDFFVDLRFYQPGSTTELSPRATPVFSGTGVTIGSSQDLYWRDADENGRYDITDYRFFGGGPHMANFYLALDGVPNTACACDFNQDELLNSQDLFDFIVPFFAGDTAADFNSDTVVNSQDFFDFLTCFFTGCP